MRICHFFIMDYQQTLNWMFSRLPMYQQQGASAYRKDLTNTILLAAHLGNPEQKVRCIHVAGTNGKGSTSSMIASVLTAAGYKTGLYTSPHLKDFRERIRINGQPIGEESVVQFIEANKPFFEEQDLSFFEMTVGMAFWYFEEEKVDVAVIETGMGGRLDSTNIITPALSVITNIGLDHMQFLGNTLTAIAGEKAGIIKKGIPVVIGEYDAETFPVFQGKAATENAPMYKAWEIGDVSYAVPLEGDYQQKNIKTVITALKAMQNEFPVTEADIAEGFRDVVKNSGLRGRWEQVHTQPAAIADTAHNSHGLKIVMHQLARQEYRILRIVLGVVNDKDLSEMLPLFPKGAVYYFCRPDVPRGLPAEVLRNHAGNLGLLGDVYSSVAEAYNAALADSAPNDFIYIGGSTFVVAEIL